MKRCLFFLAVILGACAPQPLPQEELKEVPLLEEALLPAYMEVLPLVLSQSQAFMQSPQGEAAASDTDNSAFYRYLYQDQKLAGRLKNAGFAGAEEFGAHHELVVAVFLSFLENPNLAEDAKIQLPALQKEWEALTLKKSRGPDNPSLEAVHRRLQGQVHFYRNAEILAPYMEALKALN